MPILSDLEGPYFYVGLFLVWNLVVFLRYGWDKYAAMQGFWRVSEAELLLLAFLGGSLGAKLAQKCFRHKTTKHPFARELNFVVMVQTVLLVAALVFPQQILGLVTKTAEWASPVNTQSEQSPVVKVNRGL